MAGVGDKDVSSSTSVAEVDDKDFSSAVGKVGVGDEGPSSVVGPVGVKDADDSLGIVVVGVEDEGTSGSWTCLTLSETCEKEAEQKTRVTLNDYHERQVCRQEQCE